MPDSVKLHEEDWCYVHNKKCLRVPSGEKEGQLRLKSSGPPCWDWSMFGKRGKDGGVTAPAFIVETLRLQYDSSIFLLLRDMLHEWNITLEYIENNVLHVRPGPLFEFRLYVLCDQAMATKFTVLNLTLKTFSFQLHAEGGTVFAFAKTWSSLATYFWSSFSSFMWNEGVYRCSDRGSWTVSPFLKLRLNMPFFDFLKMIKTAGPSTELTVDDFLLGEPLSDSDSRAMLTASNKRWAKDYKNMFRQHGLRVADLQQNPAERPRWGGAMFPTLTTGCTKIYNVEKKRLYSQGLMQ